MNNPTDHVCLLTSLPSEEQAYIVVNALKEAGIPATAVGGFTDALALDDAGWVQVMVTEEDLPVAKNTLAKLKEDTAEIDWSQIDVGEPE